MFCLCGCGRKTSIAKQTRSDRGQIKGESVQYIFGHRLKLKGVEHPSWKGGRTYKGNGYIVVLDPTHPNAHSDGYVAEHIAIASKALKRPLQPNEVVHHINLDRSDNRPENLLICTHSYHQSLHRRLRKLRGLRDKRGRR